MIVPDEALIVAAIGVGVVPAVNEIVTTGLVDDDVANMTTKTGDKAEPVIETAMALHEIVNASPTFKLSDVFDATAVPR